MSDQSQGPGWWRASDGRWYPPQTAPQWTPPRPAGMHGCVKALLIVGAIIGTLIALSVFGILKETDDGTTSGHGGRQASIDDDVTITSCKPDELGLMAAQLRIVNDSADRSDYSIEVAFTSASGDEQYDTSSASVESLASGQTAHDEARAFEEAPAPDYRCEVIEVDRTSAEP